MKKFISCILTIIILVLYLSNILVYAESMLDAASVTDKFAHVWDGTSDTSYEGGSGTENDPYQIATPEQLAYLREKVMHGEKYENTYFILTNDLKMNKDNCFSRNSQGMVIDIADGIKRRDLLCWWGIGDSGISSYFCGIFELSCRC